MLKYLMSLLIVCFLFVDFDLNAQDSTGITLENTSLKPTVRRINQKPKTTAEIKINQVQNDIELMANGKDNPFALIRNGIPQQSKTISMFSTTSKKRVPVQKSIEENKIEQEEQFIETPFSPIDTSSISLNKKNPFRLEGTRADRKQIAIATKIKFNPNAGTGVQNTKEKSNPLFDTSKVDVNKSDTLKFTTLTILLGLLAFVVSQFRSELVEIYHAFLNQNLMALLHRDKETIFRFPYLAIYLLTTISFGTTLFLIVNVFQIEAFENQTFGIFACILGFGAFFLFKHLILNILSILFPFKKEINLYSFTLAIFNFIIGIGILPFIALLSFADSSLHNYVLYAMLFLIGIILIYRLFRSLIIGQKYLINNKFHFFMYLCTVEIAPMIILFKFLS